MTTTSGATTTVRRPTRTRRSAHRRLEGGFISPIVRRRDFVIARALAFGVSGVIAEVALPWDNARQIAIVLLIAAVVTPLLSMVPPRSMASAYQALGDLVVIAGVVTAAPQMWPIALLWLGTNQAWLALTAPWTVSMSLATTSLAVLSVVGHREQIEDSHLTMLAGFILSAAFTSYGHALRKEIWEQESALTDALSAAGSVVHHTDLETGTVIRVEGDLEAQLGWTPEEYGALQLREFLHPDDVEHYWIDVDTVQADTVIDRLGRVRHKDGGFRWLRDVSLVSQDSRGYRTMRGFTVDVTDVQEASALVARQLRHDTLTGLPNRLALNERIVELLASDDEFALMITDLDRFKEVNDTLGHEAGDELLQIVARRLTAAVRPSDLVARLGGDEYAIVLAGGIDEQALPGIAQQLAAECARPIQLNGVDISIATSTGVSLRSRSGHDRATMLRHADIAMYEAKRGSRAFRIFDESLEQTSTLRLRLSGSLAAGIARGEIVTHFQPKYDLRSRELLGAEALARWNHPEHGLLAPGLFLDIALMSETSLEFALATVRRSVDMLAALVTSGHPMPIATNVAMRALRDPAFAPTVLATLAERGVPADLLILELTESDPLWAAVDGRNPLEELVAAGVQISIDDFGTGHSSFERLRAFRVDELKVDRTFVSGMTTDPLQRRLVHSIIDLAHRLDCRVVAEGVETEAQADILLHLGCPTGQGYLFAKPMPDTAFRALVIAERSAAAPRV